MAGTLVRLLENCADLTSAAAIGPLVKDTSLTDAATHIIQQAQRRT